MQVSSSPLYGEPELIGSLFATRSAFSHRINVNAHRYHHPESERIFRERGISAPHESIDGALSRAVSALIDIDAQLAGTFDPFFAEQLTEIVEAQLGIPGTPILTNAGRSNELPVGACTVVPLVTNSDGTLNIDRFLAMSKVELGHGLGTGYDLSDLNDPVHELKRMNNRLREINDQFKANRQRRVAAMATLRADHPKIREFINAKRHEDFSHWKFNLSVIFDGTQTRFNQLLNDIADSAHFCGEPGVLFWDRFAEDNPVPSIPYVSTAPCAEVGLAAGEQCHFFYINVAELASRNGDVDWNKLAMVVQCAVRTLDAAVEISINAGAPSIVAQKRRIGVGIMGFHCLLIKLGVAYASEEAEMLARQLSEFITFNAYAASCQLASVRGSFPAFSKSRWRDVNWIERKKAARTGIIDKKDWSRLSRKISRLGVRHASLVSYPPTGNSSELLRVSKAYEPLFSLAASRSPSAQSQNPLIEAVKQFLQQGGQRHSHVLTTALEIPASWHLRIHAAFQSFADEAGAKTINASNQTSPSEIEQMFRIAYDAGLKGLSVFRDGCLQERQIV